MKPTQRMRPRRKAAVYNKCSDCGCKYQMTHGHSKRCPECREKAAPATIGVKFRRVPSYLCACGNTVTLSPCVICVAQKKIQSEKEKR
jgi:hypothetical protein